MSREDRTDGADAIERIAHAFTPAEWSGRSLVVGIAVFAVVGAVTVVQRALVAHSIAGWLITAVHGLVVAIVVPLLSARTVREWRSRQAG